MAKFDPKKAGENADDMIAKLNQVAEGKPEEQAAVEEDAAIVTKDGTPEGEPATPAKAEDQGTPPEQSTDLQAQLKELSRRADAADQRWRVAQGMIEKKDEQIDSMRALLAQLQNAQKAAPKEPEPQPQVKRVKPSDVEDYGADMVDFVSRVAADAASEAIAAFSKTLDSRLGNLTSQVESASSTVQDTAQQTFYSRLDALVPDWGRLNDDPAFLNWIDETEPLAGKTRRALLEEAAAALDASRTAKFFLAYQQGVAVQSAQVPEVATPSEEQPTAPARPSLESLASPGKSKVSAQRPSSEGRIWEPGEITKLYADRRKKRISQEEFEKLERDIYKAQKEGRIRAA